MLEIERQRPVLVGQCFIEDQARVQGWRGRGLFHPPDTVTRELIAVREIERGDAPQEPSLSGGLGAAEDDLCEAIPARRTRCIGYWRRVDVSGPASASLLPSDDRLVDTQ